jgi:hypothetical protein
LRDGSDTGTVTTELKDLERELRVLSQDLAKGLAGLRFMSDANTARVKRLEGIGAEAKFASIGERLKNVEVLRDLGTRLAVVESMLDDLRANHRENTGKIQAIQLGDAKESAGVEKTKAKWGTITAIAVAVISGIASLVIQLMQTLAE